MKKVLRISAFALMLAAGSMLAQEAQSDVPNPMDLVHSKTFEEKEAFMDVVPMADGQSVSAYDCRICGLSESDRRVYEQAYEAYNSERMRRFESSNEAGRAEFKAAMEKLRQEREAKKQKFTPIIREARGVTETPALNAAVEQLGNAFANLAQVYGQELNAKLSPQSKATILDTLQALEGVLVLAPMQERTPEQEEQFAQAGKKLESALQGMALAATDPAIQEETKALMAEHKKMGSNPLLRMVRALQSALSQ